MGPHGRHDGRAESRLRLRGGSEAAERDERRNEGTDLVFDFTGLHRPDVGDLALILTARLQAGPGGRVWVRALPVSTWRILSALGLAHLFRVYPRDDAPVN